MQKALLDIAKQFVKRFWRSPTFNSWGSHGSRALGIFIILPFVLNKLNTVEIAIWFLFSTIMGLQLLFDSGFSITFSRTIAYAMGGASTIKELKNPNRGNLVGEPNWTLVGSIVGTMNKVYVWLSLGWSTFLIGIGTWAVVHLINELDVPVYGWIAWSMVVVTSGIRLHGAKFAAYLTGVNEIAVFRRWEALIWLLMIPANVLVLLFDGGIVGLVAVSQTFVVINVAVNRWLARSVQQSRIVKMGALQFQRNIFARIWPLVWRSGVGTFFAVSVVQISGIVYAQFGSAGEVASYLLALNLMRSLAQFSQAPFYSKLPLLAKYRVEGRLEDQVNLAERGMRLSYWTLVIGIVGIGVFGELLVENINANVSFVGQELWFLMGVATFLERYGAMHLQLYSTTNHIVWHIANSITGVIYAILVVPLFLLIGIFSFPTSQILSNILFYNWYCARKSTKAFSLQLLKFEKATSLLPLLMLLTFYLAIANFDY